MNARIGFIVASAFALIGCQVEARAGIQTETQVRYAPMVDADWRLPTPIDDHGVARGFARFDPSAGRLEDVRLTVAYGIRSETGVSLAQPATIAVASHGTLDVDRPDGTHLFEKNWQFSHGGPASAGPSMFTDQLFNEFTLTLTQSSDLALFAGLGLLDLPVRAQAFSTFLSSTGNGIGWVKTQAGAIITLQYDFEAPMVTERPPANLELAPAPSSLILLGIGGLSLTLTSGFALRPRTCEKGIAAELSHKDGAS